MHRREFIKTTAAGVTLSAFPVNIAPRIQKKYRTALIGTGWWGMNILRTAIESGTVAVEGLCDVDQSQMTAAHAEVLKLTSDQPKKYGDFRELIDEVKPELVIVATPDHWHPLITIAAIEAGAHVYVEKPIGHTILEGRAMVNAARKHGRKVQVGTHRRVSPHNVSGMEFLRSGKAGRIGMVRSFVHYGGGPGEVTPDSEPPAGLDWDMWCGPAPYRPYNERIHPRGFRQFMDYANGQIGDWGIHWLDQVLWWTDEKYPKHVYSTGDRFIKEDTSDAPDTQVATFKFESFVATWEHRLYAHNNAEKTNIGSYFYGTEGTFHMGWRDGWTFYPRDSKKQVIHQDHSLNQPDGQNIRELWADLIASIEKDRMPVCDIEIGHRSTNMSLLGVLSMNLGRSVNWDGENEMIIGDSEANKLLKRQYRSPWVYPV